jgi:hypothetical protein
MGRAYSTHSRDEKYMQKFWSKNLKAIGLSEDLGLGDNIILE